MAKKKLQKAQKGATTSDSLFIYNNALQQKAYYDKLKPYYKEPEIYPWSTTDAYIKEKEKDHLTYRERSYWTAKEKAKLNKLKTQIKNNPDPNKSYIVDLITGALDPNAPALAYDRRITPQGEIFYNPKSYTIKMSEYMTSSKSSMDYLVKDAKLSKDEIAIFDEIRKTKNNKLANIYDTYGQLTTPEEKNQLYKWAKSRGLSENAMKSLIYKKGLESKQEVALRGFATDLPYYDPIAVKPANMLTDAEFKKRYDKYGPSGLPQSRITKLGLKSNTTTNTTTNEPNNKTVPKKEEKEELVLKTKPVELLPVNRETPTIIPSNNTYNIGKDNTIVPPQSVKQWKQNPATGTWYQVERAVNPMFSPKYNLNTGSYQGGGEKNDYIDIEADDTEIGKLIAQGYIVEELPKAQSGMSVDEAYNYVQSIYNKYNKIPEKDRRYKSGKEMHNEIEKIKIAENILAKAYKVPPNKTTGTYIDLYYAGDKTDPLYHNAPSVWVSSPDSGEYGLAAYDWSAIHNQNNIGKLPIKHPETPALEIVPQTFKYTPKKQERIPVANRSQTIMEPDPDREGKYRVKELRQVPYSANFPGEGWQPANAPRVLYIDSEGNEVEERPKELKQLDLTGQVFAYGGDISIPDLNQYEDGGEYDLTQEEIDNLIAQGYQVEDVNTDEYKKGGTPRSLPKKKSSKAYSRSLTATNKLFAQSPLTKKSKSRKNKIFDPNAKQFEKGGFQDDLGKHRKLIRDWTYGQSIGMLQKAQTGEEIKNLPGVTVKPKTLGHIIDKRPEYNKGYYDPFGVSDNTLENAVEIFDPTGASSWDDIIRSYKNTGLSPETALEVFGAIPLLGKLGSLAKPGIHLKKYKGLDKTLYKSLPKNKTVSNTLSKAATAGRATDIYQAVDEGFKQTGGESVIESRTPWTGAANVTGEETTPPVIFEGKDVTVKAQGPKWAKFQKEYESSKPWEKFLYGEQEKYLRKNKGLNKAAGVSMDNFPQAERIRIKQEYDQKMNDYITRRLGKSEGFNPRRRGEWVDQLTDREKQIVAGSRYGSKLQPDVWSRLMSGARSIYNAGPLSNLTGDITAKVPGYTKKENKAALNNWMEGLEVAAPTEIPGIAIANYVTHSNPRIAKPGNMSGEYMADVSPLTAAALNPLTYIDLATGLVEIPHLIAMGANALKKGAKYVGKGVDAANTVDNVGRSFTQLDEPLSLRDVRTNELAKGRPFATMDEGVKRPLRAESFSDPGDLNLTPGTEAWNAYEPLRIRAAGAEQPIMKTIPLQGSKYVQDESNRLWRRIDDMDVNMPSKDKLEEFGLDEEAFAFKPMIDRETGISAENENLIENIKVARERAEASGNTALVDAYDAKIKEMKQAALKDFTESYTGSEAMTDVKGGKLNMFEPTPGEEYAMLKDIDPTDAKKEVYQTISDAIEDTRANKVEKWQTAEGQKRLQNMIDTTPYLKNIGMTPESYVESIVNLENANKTYLEKLMDLDKINEKMLNLDREKDLGYIDEQFYWDQIMDLEKEVLSKRDEIADIRGEINSSGKYNAFMQGTGKIGIGENIDPLDLKQTIEHEISHLLQAGSKTSLDKELSRLKLIEDDLFSDLPLTFNPGKSGWLDFINSPEYLESSKQYFKFEAEGREKLAMVSELRQDLLDRGIIKDIYDKITPQMLEKHFDKYISKGTGKKTIPLRVYDIMEDDESNFKLLANVLNKLPAAVPIAIGVGTAVGAGMQGTEQRQLGQTGPYQFQFGGAMELELSPEEVQWYIDNGYNVEDI